MASKSPYEGSEDMKGLSKYEDDDEDDIEYSTTNEQIKSDKTNIFVRIQTIISYFTF